MDLNKIFDLLTKSNIDTNAIYDLINEASSMDLSKEENLRLLIRKGTKIANRNISLEDENNLINTLKEKGISKELFSFLSNS